ncbi:MAG: zinc-dependent peptidase [Gammaproteobacteria bacterium]|nr:zinc-dependent peptidase [Gammaproteobacteria bacterium]
MWRPFGSRKRLAERVVAEHWARSCEPLALLARCSRRQRLDLQALCVAFLARKRLEPAADLVLDDELALLIAVQACLPVLELGIRWYDDWVSVIVYPDDFVARHEVMDEAGVVHEDTSALSGEAWVRGPVLLSVPGVMEGARGEGWGNLVIHEMAHKLDLRNGAANGMPPLHAGMSTRRWSSVFSAAYAGFRRRLASGAPDVLDGYAAEDPGEFFAVASEAFFVMPEALGEQYPDLYAQLVEFYRQDPAAGAPAGLSPAGG